MSYFVTITFDITNAPMSTHGIGVYRKIANSLDQLDYSKVVQGKRKKTETKLPANTYVAEFEEEEQHQTDIIDFVKMELKRIFKTHEVSGKYFISTGKQWAWKIGTF
ncbi:hypothetical protein J7I01_002703 [Vibrio parahaemolyticus]|nr:hypothetical protein [Vibrio parahaemolyticus]